MYILVCIFSTGKKLMKETSRETQTNGKTGKVLMRNVLICECSEKAEMLPSVSQIYIYHF